jgi:hypothetical protein
LCEEASHRIFYTSKTAQKRFRANEFQTPKTVNAAAISNAKTCIVSKCSPFLSQSYNLKSMDVNVSSKLPSSEFLPPIARLFSHSTWKFSLLLIFCPAVLQLDIVE